ncbi:MAG: hypothetical protein LBD71_02575 [Treponema sp.]|nr:hypothetical protein [Treponema sp.]
MPDSTPAAEPETPDLGPLNRALARAEEARKKAQDFDGPAYFSGEWEAAETQYSGAGALSRTNKADVQQALVLYNSAADAYEGIFRESVPLYAQDRENEILSTRNEVIATGLTGQFPEYLYKADMVSTAALAQYKAEDYYAAKDSAASALSMYTALKTGAGAYLTRQEIVNRNFVHYDSENFSRADQAGLAAVNSYDTGENERAISEAEEAALRYKLALDAGWASYAADRGAIAGAERQKALDLKANVAVKEDFNNALKIYNQAETALRAKNHEQAAALYIQSESEFAAAGRMAVEKRRIAEEAIRLAEEKMIESEENARNAELILEGGAQ